MILRSFIAIDGTSIILPCFPKKISGTIVLLNSFSVDENMSSLTLSVIFFDIELNFKVTSIHFLDPSNLFSSGTDSIFLTPSRLSLSSPLLFTLSTYTSEYEIELFLSLIFKTYPNILGSMIDNLKSILKLSINFC